MKSAVIKRSILINGRKTSVSLENEFWAALHEIAVGKNTAVSAMVERIDSDRENINLSSAVRVFVLNHFRPRAKMRVPQAVNSGRRNTNSGSLRARAEECRALAEAFSDAETREIMLRVAADYEMLASRIERTVNIEDEHSETA
jgi:predicted DNA-binding ribbon-helix-helix protein